MLFQNCYYGRFLASDQMQPQNLEGLSTQIVEQIYGSVRRKHPYSIAMLESYLHAKEQEIRRIITIIEGIRYGLGATEIYALVTKGERRSVL